ncbi:unnamed protein product [Cyclocybe aegerita]|uniref:Extracellular membrane protein CFEM domain-containing protein n=1 Tax=Cyclocybe aegerita TaxID=1973307 RepID=A0A8S0W937_CYCAE|nr:unnamed protein product [Cyclocybe aegerita]
MFSPVVVLAFFTVLAGRVLAFNITVGTRNLGANEILAIPDSPVKTACASICTPASTAIAACNDDTACLCRTDTVTAFVNCETCMLHNLINTNKPAPDIRAGSNVAVGAYAGVCKTDLNITLPANLTALALPATWDGPFVSVLPVGAAAVTVIAGGILGFSALYILSNLE